MGFGSLLGFRTCRFYFMSRVPASGLVRDLFGRFGGSRVDELLAVKLLVLHDNTKHPHQRHEATLDR